jgi:putative MATE family efflux protein
MAVREAAVEMAGPSRADRLLDMAPLAAILRLAGPTTLVMAIGAVSNVVYTYFVSRLGTDAIGAVSLVFPVSLLAMTAMAGGIGAGAASAIARALGGGRRDLAARTAWQALALSVALGLLLALVIFLGARPLFRLMGARGPVLELATAFAHVLFGGAAITFLGGMFDSVLRGEGNVRVPALWSITSLLLQMAVTPLLVFTAGLGLEGAALAMLVCQLLATIGRALYVFGGRGVVRPSAARWPRALEPTWEVLRVGVPAALSTSVANVGLMVLTAIVARLGDAHLAAYGLVVRFDFLLLSFAYGFSAAVLTLVGMAAGAERHDRIRTYVVRAGITIAALLAVPGALFWWRPALWFGLFSDDPGIHAVGATYFRIVGPSYPFVGVSMVVGFAFQGFGRATIPLVWTIVRVAAMLAVAVACTRVFGLGFAALSGIIAVGNVVSAFVLAALFVRARP